MTDDSLPWHEARAEGGAPVLYLQNMYTCTRDAIDDLLTYGIRIGSWIEFSNLWIGIFRPIDIESTRQPTLWFPPSLILPLPESERVRERERE